MIDSNLVHIMYTKKIFEFKVFLQIEQNEITFP